MTTNCLIRNVFKWILVGLGFAIVIIAGVLIYYDNLAIKREVAKADYLAPNKGGFVSVNDLNIFYQELGPKNGAPIVLIHGTGSWSEIWRETMIELSAKGYRTIAIDLPPFGFSGKPKGVEQYSTEKQGRRINEVISALDLTNVVLLGHSVGARATIDAVLQDSSRVSKLILVDAAVGFSTDNKAGRFQHNTPSFLMKLAFQLKSLRDAIFRSTGLNPKFTKLFFETFVYNKASVTSARVSMLQEPYAIENYSESNADWFEYLTVVTPHKGLSTNFENYKLVDLPVLIIWGEEDEVTPLWQGKVLSGLFPNSDLRIIKETGHIPYIENTKIFNNEVLFFLNNI